MKLSVAQKGLLVATLPLLFEIGFLWKLSTDLMNAQRASNRIANRREVAAEASRILMSFFSVGSSVLTYGVKGSTLEVPAFAKLRMSVDESLARLRVLSKPLSQDDQDHIANLESRLRAAVDLIGSYITEMTSPAHKLGSFDVPRFRRSLMAQVNPFIDEISYFAESDATVPAPADSANTIIAGVVLNLGLAMLLVIYFSKSIKRRVEVLQTNASRFQKGKMLKHRLRDEDEISALDASFHDMADRLTAANLEMRQYYLTLNNQLNAPLASLKDTLLSLSESTSDMNDDGRVKLKKSAGSVDRLVRLINELTTIEEKAAGKVTLQLSDINLNDLVSSAIGAVADYAAKKEIEVSQAVPADLIVAVDRDKLIQVIVNLLSNALKFSPAKSKVNVHVDVVEKTVTVHVIDQGTGIRTADKERLFKRFEQADNQGVSDIKGSGLGLSICRDIIEAHGGEMGVDSEFGKGSDFWFRLAAP